MLTLSDMSISVSERGIEQVRIYADDESQSESALLLLASIEPELKALENKLRKPVKITADNLLFAKDLLERARPATRE